MTKPSTPFIGFRPGDLRAELEKRGPRVMMSLVAKDLLEQALKLLRAERQGLARTFSIAETQVLFAVFDRQAGLETCDPMTVVRAIHEDDQTVHDLIETYGVERTALVGRLLRLGPAEIFALRDAAAMFRSHRPDRRLGPDGYPSIEILRDIGLIAGVVANAWWGVCLVRQGDGEVIIPMRRPPWLIRHDRTKPPIGDLIDRIFTHADAKRRGVSDPVEDEIGGRAVYELARRLRLRRFILQQTPEAPEPSSEEMSAEDLVRITDASSGRSLKLAGINAPEMEPPSYTESIDEETGAIEISLDDPR